MERRKFYIPIIILLVVINAATLVLLWTSRKRPHHRPPHKTPREVVIQELKFTGEQENKYDVLIREHQQAIRMLQDSLQYYRDEVYNEPAFSDPSRGTASIASIARIQQEIEYQTYLHFRKVMEICTPGQKERYLPVIRKAVKIMGHHPQGPPPH